MCGGSVAAAATSLPPAPTLWRLPLIEGDPDRRAVKGRVASAPGAVFQVGFSP
jgi:hypothetical protein